MGTAIVLFPWPNRGVRRRLSPFRCGVQSFLMIRLEGGWMLLSWGIVGHDVRIKLSSPTVVLVTCFIGR